MPMNFTLTKVEYFASMSEETSCYRAVLCLDGKPVAEVSNRGTGGCDDQHPLNGADLDALNAQIKASYPPNTEYGITLEYDLELVCGDLLNDWITLRDLKAKMRTRVLLREGKDLFTVKVPKPHKPADDKVRAHFAAKYPNATILNGLPDTAILEHAKATGA